MLSLALSGNFLPGNCDELEGALGRMNVDLRVLGRHIPGMNLVEQKGTCSGDGTRMRPLTHATYKVSYSLDHAYRFYTMATTMQVQLNESAIACTAANITPYIGSTSSRALKTVPFAIMVLSGILTGVLRVFRNRARSIFRYELTGDAHDPAESYVPGIGNCLHHLQFIFLSGCLTLSYPGCFRAVVSEVAWSSLVFKNWPVTHQFVYPGVQDNIYAVNATHGADAMAQYLGTTATGDLWTNSIVNLALVILGVVVVFQLTSISQWMWQLYQTRDSSLIVDPRTGFLVHVQRTGWAVARTVLDYFIHPLVCFSLLQTNVASWFPVYRTFIAVAFVVLLAASMAAIVHHLAKTDRHDVFFPQSSFPRQSSRGWVSDILYGVPFLRGVAIGALQPYGIGQIVVLVCCEISILACVLWNWRTGLFWKHTCLSTARLVVIAMSCVFLPGVSASERTQSVAGYCILALHVAVLLCVFVADCVYELFEFISWKLRNEDSSPGTFANRPEKAPVFGIGRLSQRSTRRISFAHLPPLDPGGGSTSHLHSRPLRGSSSSDDGHSHDGRQSFFRVPRSLPASVSSRNELFPVVSSVSQVDSQDGTASMESIELDLLEPDSNPRYSAGYYAEREADAYYGQPSTSRMAHGADPPDETLPPGRQFWGWKRSQKKEKGFEVIRPRGGG
ncbi:hypothetical protein FE257_006992 [Aspergillus nanangensis]|uniref:TRP C-terminal domain-containing protein n=1 Tax=Aspergillus nanangensis TaxID=2582783 RepID=A0AAD4CND8_ASPNN|nr:hypothetical protein FE257_006992 [Aspergillus nanangensis]